jgi:hypothetical protein
MLALLLSGALTRGDVLVFVAWCVLGVLSQWTEEFIFIAVVFSIVAVHLPIDT